MIQPFNLLIVDDLPRARQSIKALLSAGFSLNQVQEANSGIDALQKIETFSPDLIVMDVRMPGMDGIEATRMIKSEHPRIKIILLSMYAEYRDQALEAGADAFVNKEEPGELITAANLAIPKSNKI